MLDGVSLDQLRTFIAAVDEGSFSAAARKLLRAQSVVSETVSNLEDQIGVPLFDRSGRYPRLTPEGVVLLADARNVGLSTNNLEPMLRFWQFFESGVSRVPNMTVRHFVGQPRQLKLAPLRSGRKDGLSALR
jgi:DNA-binding transcriptional LysR family regulator